MTKNANAINPITKNLSKLLSKDAKKITTKQRKRKDKKGIDEDSYKIKESYWKDSVDEINQDNFEENENENNKTDGE
jgi:hypothetical protein